MVWFILLLTQSLFAQQLCPSGIRLDDMAKACNKGFESITRTCKRRDLERTSGLAQFNLGKVDYVFHRRGAHATRGTASSRRGTGIPQVTYSTSTRARKLREFSNRCSTDNRRVNNIKNGSKADWTFEELEYYEYFTCSGRYYQKNSRANQRTLTKLRSQWIEVSTHMDNIDEYTTPMGDNAKTIFDRNVTNVCTNAKNSLGEFVKVSSRCALAKPVAKLCMTVAQRAGAKLKTHSNYKDILKQALYLDPELLADANRLIETYDLDKATVSTQISGLHDYAKTLSFKNIHPKKSLKRLYEESYQDYCGTQLSTVSGANANNDNLSDIEWAFQQKTLCEVIHKSGVLSSTGFSKCGADDIHNQSIEEYIRGYRTMALNDRARCGFKTFFEFFDGTLTKFPAKLDMPESNSPRSGTSSQEPSGSIR